MRLELQPSKTLNRLDIRRGGVVGPSQRVFHTYPMQPKSSGGAEGSKNATGNLLHRVKLKSLHIPLSA